MYCVCSDGSFGEVDMARRFTEIKDSLREFIGQQQMFCVGSAADGLFRPLPGARQIFDLAVDLVQTSCGQAVPFFEHAGTREELNEWAGRKGEQGIRDYWRDRNQRGLDGQPTGILAKTAPRLG